MEINSGDGNYPLLDTIHSPADLKRLEVDQLPQLCSEIRFFLLRTLSSNPGHLGSNLGSVEATVALHYVYDSPTDKIIWDVGHQSYTHKLLTGRRGDFGTLRKWGGLSGFPSPGESEHDCFVAGHASNSISAALGFAVAHSKAKTGAKTVAFIGDGAMTGGLAFEGLNNASSFPNDLLIILNDNNMSIDKNVGGLNKYLVDLLTSQTYNTVRKDIYHGLKKLGLIEDKNKKDLLTLNNKLKSLVSRRHNIFDSFSVRYFGPVDGNDVIRMVHVLRDLKDLEGPQVLHISTIKGKGYAQAEAEPTIWHAPGKFDPNTGKRQLGDETGQPSKFQDVFGHTLLELARADERIVGITPAMPTGCSMNILAEAMPDRAYDVGIAEGHAVTFASGLATAGLIPFCNIYSSFMQRAYDQLIHDVALQGSKVIFCLDRAGLVGEDGSTHQGAFDLSFLRNIPTLTIASPMDEVQLRHLMYSAYKCWDGASALRYPRGKGSVVDWRQPFQEIRIGKGRRLVDGGKVVFLSIGPIGVDVAQVVAKLRDEGYDVGHVDMVFVKPLDTKILSEVLDQGASLITVEEGCLIGGFGSAVLEYMADHGYNNAIRRMGIPDTFVPHGTPIQQRVYCGLSQSDMYDEAIALLGQRND